jgi:hypothetical protein
MRNESCDGVGVVFNTESCREVELFKSSVGFSTSWLYMCVFFDKLERLSTGCADQAAPSDAKRLALSSRIKLELLVQAPLCNVVP